MKQAARRWALLVAVGLLVVVLVGGRWAAFETAERVWAAIADARRLHAL